MENGTRQFTRHNPRRYRGPGAGGIARSARSSCSATNQTQRWFVPLTRNASVRPPREMPANLFVELAFKRYKAPGYDAHVYVRSETRQGDN